MEHKKGIIFDLDGVLLHSTGIHRDAFAEVFQQFSVTGFDYARYAGWRTADVVADVLKPSGIVDPQVLRRACEQKTALARERLAQRQPLDADCGRVLADLAADHELGLASSGSRAGVDAFLAWSGSRSLFRSILTGEDVARAKPDPELYLRSLEQLGVEPHDALVVEDAASGVMAAREAGAHVVGIAGTCAEADLLKAGAAAVLPKLGDFPTFARQNAPPPSIDPARWTAIIPAAGKGSRLGFHRAKILYPVADRLILDWLLDFLTPTCARLVFVLSAEAREDVTAELEQCIPGRFDVAVQNSPTGMGDAVALGLSKARTPHVLVVWGDQVAVRRSSVETCQRLHESPLQPVVTCPTVVRDRPYIHFDRDSRGTLTGLKQAREGDPMPSRGESDTGLFCFQTACLKALLEEARAAGSSTGAATREFNLLPVIPHAAARSVVLTPRHMGQEETIGVNSASDVAAVEPFLKRADGYR